MICRNMWVSWNPTWIKLPHPFPVGWLQRTWISAIRSFRFQITSYTARPPRKSLTWWGFRSGPLTFTGPISGKSWAWQIKKITSENTYYPFINTWFNLLFFNRSSGIAHLYAIRYTYGCVSIDFSVIFGFYSVEENKLHIFLRIRFSPLQLRAPLEGLLNLFGGRLNRHHIPAVRETARKWTCPTGLGFWPHVVYLITGDIKWVQHLAA